MDRAPLATSREWLDELIEYEGERVTRRQAIHELVRMGSSEAQAVIEVSRHRAIGQ